MRICEVVDNNINLKLIKFRESFKVLNDLFFYILKIIIEFKSFKSLVVEDTLDDEDKENVFI